MPKNEKFSPKDLANRMKSKGLQKLRWYCQMCQKQCRDQNGFKCHISSESHQRQLLLFGDNPNKYLSDFNATFQKGFLDILRRQYGTKRVRANQVYGEYIRDKEHTHMNATSWHTLTGFIHYLARVGIVKIDQTEKGWYITYIDREEEKQKERDAKKVKMDRDDDELIAEFVTQQAEKDRQRALENGEDLEAQAGSELVRSEGEAAVKLELKRAADKDLKPSTSALPTAFQAKRPKAEAAGEGSGGGKRSKDRPKAKSALDEIRDQEERRKERSNRKEHWLAEGIVVKVVAKRLGDAVHKRKGVVAEMVDDFTAMVRILQGGALVKLDQVQHWQGVVAEMVDDFTAMVRILQGGALVKLDQVQHWQGVVAEMVDDFTAMVRILQGGALVKLDQVQHWQGVVAEMVDDFTAMVRILQGGALVKLDQVQHWQGVVAEMVDDFTAMVRILQGGALVKLDQTHCETVIPNLGKPVRVLNGAYRGCRAILDSLDQEAFAVNVVIDEGAAKGRLVKRVAYDDVSKLHVA